MAMKRPLVSVIVPLYNHDRFVKRAICSVLDQNFSDLELIVVNDGSKDGSEAQVKIFDDPRIRYFKQPNRGAHSALNRGVRLARGKYIAILNSDDVYHEHRLEQCLKICERDPKVGACFSHIRIIDERGRLQGSIDGANHNSAVMEHTMNLRNRNEILLDLLGGNFLATTSNLFCRRAVLIKAGPFKPFRYAHDYDFFLRLCAVTRIQVIGRQLLFYRVHRNNTIKENRAATHFEHAIILARLLASDAIVPIFTTKKKPYEMMTRLFNSLETFTTDKTILILLLFLLNNKDLIDKFELDLVSNLKNPFRMRSIAFLQNQRRFGAPKERIRDAVCRLNARSALKGPVYLFGAGEFSRIVYKHLKKRQFRPIGYFDNNSKIVGSVMNKLPVESPRLIPGIKVIIASSAMRPIYQQLRKLGYSSTDIILVK
jgi:glycosyltransferase involved in cell wall biosynthesis